MYFIPFCIVPQTPEALLTHFLLYFFRSDNFYYFLNSIMLSLDIFFLMLSTLIECFISDIVFLFLFQEIPFGSCLYICFSDISYFFTK